MTDPVGTCPDHGPASGERCPVCGTALDPLLDGGRREQLSTFLSGLLRHFPDEYGLALDRAGWADRQAVVEVVTDRYDWATPAAVAAVVAADPKGRFERDRGRIRAAYGHSVDVDLDAGAGDGGEAAPRPADVPGTLYHGTAPRHLDSILDEGLRPMGRQEVHLSPDVGTARAVGRRHADAAAVLRVDAAGLREAGHPVRRRGPETFTTDRVPPRFLTVVEGGR